MAAQTSNNHRSFLLIAAFAPLVVFALLNALEGQYRDSDIFWALKSGEWIIANMEVPRTDPFSYTFAGEPWIDFTWGFQVIAHVFYSYLGGWYGLFLLQTSLVAAVFYIVYKNLSLVSSGRAWLSVCALYIVYAAIYGRLFIRPHLFGFLFIVLYIYLLNLYERKGEARYLWALVPLQILWTNVHSSFVLGIFIAGAYGAGFFVDAVRKHGFSADLPDRLKKMIIICAALPLATLFNPYGWRLSVFPFIHQGGDNTDALRYIAEWAKTPITEMVFNFSPEHIFNVGFKLVLYGAVVSMVLNRKNFKLHYAILFIASVYLALSHVRWLTMVALFSTHILVENVSDLLDEHKDLTRFYRGLFAASAVVIAGLLLIETANSMERGKYGPGLSKGHYPEGTVAFLGREVSEVRVYNSYGFGGYLIFNDIPVMIDGRTPTVFSPLFYWKIRKARSDSGWARLSEEFDLTAALIKSDHPECDLLMNDDEWKLAVFDDTSVLFLKDVEANSDALRKVSVSTLSPCEDKERIYRSLPGAEEELLRSRSELKNLISYMEGAGLSGRVAKPWRMLGLVDARLGEGYLEEGLLSYEAVLDTAPDSFVYYDMGLTLSRMGRGEEAAAAFKKSIAMNESFAQAYLVLAMEYMTSSDFESAAEHLERHLELALDSAGYDAYYSLGRSCHEIDRLDCAVRNYSKAAFLAGDDKVRADMHYKAGSALLMAGEYDKAMGHYSRAIKVEPEYVTVIEALSSNLDKVGSPGRASVLREFLEKLDE